MRKLTLAAGMALGLFAMPLIASAQDAPAAAPDAGAAAAPAAGDASMAAPAAKTARHARTHRTKANRTPKHHVRTKPGTTAPAATEGGDAK